MNTVVDLGRAVKAKYPGDYDDLSDAVLGELMKQKFPGAYDDFAPLPQGPPLGKAEGIRGPLTLKENAINLGRQVVQSIPETAGMLLGGLKGAAMGSPAGPPGAALGAIAGAGAGAGLGKGAEMGLRNLFPSIFKKPEGNVSPVEELGTSMKGAMLGEAGGRAISEVLPSVLSRYIKPNTLKEIGTLEKEGVPYSAGDVRPGGAAQILENLTRGTLLGGKIMSDFDVAQASKLFAFKQRFLNSIGPLFTKQETGNLIKESVETRAKDLFSKGGVFDKAYTKIATLYPINVDTAQIRSEIQPILKETQELIKKGRIPSASSPESPSKYLKVLEDLAVYGTRKSPKGIVDVPITYMDIWKDKQTIQSIIRNMGDDSLRTRAKATLQRVEDILDTAMENTAARVNPQAGQYVKKVNSAYREAKRLMETESIVADMRNGNYEPERIVSRFFEGDNVTPTSELLRAIPPREKATVLPVIRRRTLENIFSKATTPISEEGITVTSGKRLLTMVDKDREALNKLLTKEQMESLDSFVRASQRGQSSGSMTNPMSGRQMLALGQAGSALQIVGTGWGLIQGDDVGDKFLLASTMFLGPKFLAHAITNPKLAKLIAKGFTMDPATANRIGWTSRVANIVRIFNESNPEKEQEAP